MFVRIDEFKWIQNTAVDYFYIGRDANKYEVVFGLRNGNIMRSKKFETPKDAEKFARTVLSMRDQED